MESGSTESSRPLGAIKAAGGSTSGVSPARCPGCTCIIAAPGPAVDSFQYFSTGPPIIRSSVPGDFANGFNILENKSTKEAALKTVMSGQYNKHLFVHIGQSSPSYSDPYLEVVDIRQIYDKFPEKKGGLKELFERGPSDAFFLVKFSADLNTNIEDEGSAFYGVSSRYESPENMIITCSTKVCSFGKQVVEKVEVIINRCAGDLVVRYLYL